MPIYRLLQNLPMGPEEVNRMTTAFEKRRVRRHQRPQRSYGRDDREEDRRDRANWRARPGGDFRAGDP